MSDLQLLLVEDDAGLAQMLTRGLTNEKYRVKLFRDGRSGLKELQSSRFDLCILDILLPGQDGFQVLKQARQSGVGTPILMLTARDAVSDRVQGLKLGADDYLVKPFAFAELLARLEALLRRGTVLPGKLQVADIVLDPATRQVSRSGVPVAFSHRQFQLLEMLLRHVGQVVPRTMILRRLWGYDFDPGSNLVDVHVAHLRQKLDTPDRPSLIQSIRGVGYKLQRTADV